MKCNRNRNRLHCQFNRNRRLHSRLNSEIFTLHHCALNRGLVAGFPPLSSFVMVMFQGRPLDCLCALNSDSPAASTTFAAKSRFVPATLLVGLQK